MKNFQISTFFGAALLLICAISSCGKSNKDTAPGITSHNVKFTITVAGGAAADNPALINLVFNAAATSNKTIWAINGVQQANEAVLKLSGTDFPSGKTTTLVITSLVPVYDANANLRFANSASLPAYTISYKAEIDGKIQNDDENISINGTNVYDHTYTY